MSRPFTFDRMCRILITLLFIAGFVWLVNVLRNVLLPFCLACLIAYILEPIVEFGMHKLHIRWRIVSIFLTLGGVGAVIAGLAYLFIPSIVSEVNEMTELVRKYSDSGDIVPFLPKEIQDSISGYFNTDNMNRLIEGGKLESLLSKGASLLSTSVEYLFHALEWFLTFIYVIFILLDYRTLMRGFQLLVPRKYRPIASRVSDDIKTSMNHYFRGQAVIAL